MPKPNKGETEQAFVSRYISYVKNETPDRPMNQIRAMCYDIYRRNKISQSKEGKMKNETVNIDNTTIVDLKSSKIDSENMVIRRMSILSKNAYDRDGKVFRRFSDDAMTDALQVFNGAIARVDHDREITDSGASRGVKTGYGVFKDLTMSDGMIYGDLHLWDCPEAKKVLSIAQRTPSAVGNSIHTGGILGKSEKGIEIIARLLNRNSSGNLPSVDLVDDPAATMGVFNSKPDNENKENDMEFKDITLEALKSNRPDLVKTLSDEGAKSRDEEVKTLTQEKEGLATKLDSVNIEMEKSKRNVMAEKLLSESDLPDYAKTDTFKKQLMEVSESKDGDKIITVEDKMKELIQDRLEATEPNGVHENHEKDLSQNKGDKVSNENFVETFSAQREY
jgi:hypothetical protein